MEDHRHRRRKIPVRGGSSHAVATPQKSGFEPLPRETKNPCGFWIDWPKKQLPPARQFRKKKTKLCMLPATLTITTFERSMFH
jgi:hypothetical protein